jgi:predicted unusual protein kinase regulating ubiquinone biosynthesis (AarF/ABC1/UbiB family)
LPSPLPRRRYPEAERFFELDFAVMKLALWYVNPELLDVVKKQQDIFAKEFDYKQEAANLRRMVNEVGGRDFGKAAVTFPEPFEHLTTRKVLVMRKMGGKTLTKIGHELIEELAKSR